MHSQLIQLIDLQALGHLCSKFGVKELSLFGSSVTDTFGPESDIDLLVEFGPDADPSLLDMVALREELKTLFGGREIDLISKEALLKHHNLIRKQSILENTEMLYAA